MGEKEYSSDEESVIRATKMYSGEERFTIKFPLNKGMKNTKCAWAAVVSGLHGQDWRNHAKRNHLASNFLNRNLDFQAGDDMFTVTCEVSVPKYGFYTPKQAKDKENSIKVMIRRALLDSKISHVKEQENDLY
jgi:hypothetical protein